MWKRLLIALFCCCLLSLLTFTDAFQPQPQQLQLQPVSVTVHRKLPSGISPAQALDVWHSFVFAQGGGLPFVAVVNLSKKKRQQPAKSKTSAKDPTSDCQSRLLLPLFAREALVPAAADFGKVNHGADDDDARKSQCVVQYRLTELGPMFGLDIVPDSHLGTVTFTHAATDDGEREGEHSSDAMDDDVHDGRTEMSWTVQFDVTNRAAFWETFTHLVIGLTCDNLVAYLDTPWLYQCTTPLHGQQVSTDSDSSSSIEPKDLLKPKDAAEMLVDFLCQGSGLPLPPPIQWRPNVSGQSNDDETEQSPIELVRLPIFLRERFEPIQSSSVVVSDDAVEVSYRVMNPGWLTYPVYTHRGRVRFRLAAPLNCDDDDDNHHHHTAETVTTVAAEKCSSATTTIRGLLMDWEVEIRPFFGCGTFVRWFTAAVASAISKKFAESLADKEFDKTCNSRSALTQQSIGSSCWKRDSML